MPKISVIIPTYNCAQYIGDAIKSVLDQSFKDYEIIIVDDGSTDDTKEMLNSFIADNIIQYIYQKNEGQSVARNNGILAARGEYIAFLDADDILLPESLQKREIVLSKHPEIAMVFSDYNEQYITNTIYSRLKRDNFEGLIKDSTIRSNKKYSIISKSFIHKYFEFSISPVWTGTVMIRKALVKSIGLFKTDLRASEDTDYWLRIMEKYDIGYIDEALAVYSKRTNFNEEKYLFRTPINLEVMSSFLKKGINKTVLRKKISQSAYALASYYVSSNQMTNARQFFLMSLKYNPLHFRPLIYLGLSFLPKRVIASLKNARAKQVK